MKALKKPAVAVVLTILMIALAVGIGYARRPTAQLPAGLDSTLSTAQYTKWMSDEAGVLSASTEETLALFNANWDQRYHSLVAIQTVDTVSGSLEDYAFDLTKLAGFEENTGKIYVRFSGGGTRAYPPSDRSFSGGPCR